MEIHLDLEDGKWKLRLIRHYTCFYLVHTVL